MVNVFAGRSPRPTRARPADRRPVDPAAQPPHNAVFEDGRHNLSHIPVSTENPCQPFHVAGATKLRTARSILRVAWTLDDGPTTFTESMRATLGQRRGTWYIMRSRLPGAGTALTQRLAEMKKLQDAGHEFAVHSFHPTLDHTAWFPVQLSGTHRGYERVDDSMRDLRAFVKLLRDNGLRIAFVRHPGGLFSELRKYVVDRGVLAGPEEDARSRRSVATRQVETAGRELERIREQRADTTTGAAASATEQRLRESRREVAAAVAALDAVERGRRVVVRWIIDDRDLSGLAVRDFGFVTPRLTEQQLATLKTQAAPVQRDHRLVQRTLADLGLREWGGSAPGEPIVTMQSWEAESSASGLTNDVLQEFAKRIRKIVEQDVPESLVVLAHDVNKANVMQVGRDVVAMEKLATERGVRVEYYTMSALARCLWRETPMP